MVLLMSGATAAIGLLPSWHAAGLLAPTCLVLLRLVQGFASGGGISSSIPYLLELAPARRWGLYGGWHTATVALGIACGIGAAGLLTAVLPHDALHSWGWRVPFLLAIPLGAAGLYVRRRLGESPAFSAASRSARDDAALKVVWREHGATVRTGFVLVSVLAGTFNMWFVFLPAHLVARDAHHAPGGLGCAAAGLMVAAIAAPRWGRLSDRVGRRPLLLAGTAGLCALVVPSYAAAAAGSWPALLLADMAIGLFLAMLVISAHLAEQLPVVSPRERHRADLRTRDGAGRRDRAAGGQRAGPARTVVRHPAVPRTPGSRGGGRVPTLPGGSAAEHRGADRRVRDDAMGYPPRVMPAPVGWHHRVEHDAYAW